MLWFALNITYPHDESVAMVCCDNEETQNNYTYTHEFGMGIKLHKIPG
jgi:hypothetical protein